MNSNTRKTIGTNPLDAVIPDLRSQRGAGVSPTGVPPTVVSPAGAAQRAERRAAKRKERLTIHLPVETIERAKNAVFWTPGLTLADLGERALGRLLDDLEKERGEKFAPRLNELKGGRPVKR